MERLFQILSQTKTFTPTRPPQFDAVSTTIGKPGRMNAPQALFHDRKVPAFLIEQRIANKPKAWGANQQLRIEKRSEWNLIQSLWTAVQNPASESQEP